MPAGEHRQTRALLPRAPTGAHDGGEGGGAIVRAMCRLGPGSNDSQCTPALSCRPRAARARLLPPELFMQLSHAPADAVRANRAMLRRKPPEQRLASISSYSSDSDSKATAEARGGLMRTSWAWQVVGDSRAGFSRLASVAILRAKDLRGRSKVNNYFIKFSHSFLFKSQT